jgi:tetratricopeptide (TPR) repeat protein
MQPKACRNAYNHGVVFFFLRSRFVSALVSGRLAVALLIVVACVVQVAGQMPQAGSGRILLVLPFDNLSASPSTPASAPANGTAAQQTTDPISLDWIREAAPEILNSRFASAGFLPLSREDRLYALDHLGLPEGFQPSRATALRLAQTLDADYILTGSYNATATTLTLKSRIVDVGKLRLSEEISVSGEISQLIPLLNSLAWRLTRKLDPSFGVAEETFRAAGSKIRLDAFEQYIRGLTERDATERLRHLKKATDLSPDFTEAWLATGKLQFANQKYEEAAVCFGKVTRGPSVDDPSELEAAFYRGLSLMFSGNYPRAEEAFAAVARVLPLAEVVNNEGVAMSRRGHDSAVLFRQAVGADPTDADYHFNLAVSLHRNGDYAGALAEMGEYLKLRPNDSEAKTTQQSWQTATVGDSSTGPLERIKRSYNGAAFRQAGLMLDQVESARLAALPGPERAAKLTKSAREKLDRGLLLEAEREYQAALAADDHNAEAHAGLAQVRERVGDNDGARQEAKVSLDRQPNVEAYLVLARLDLAANQLSQARDEAAEAAKLDGSSRAAKDLRRAIDSRIESQSGTNAKPAATPPATSNP